MLRLIEDQLDFKDMIWVPLSVHCAQSVLKCVERSLAFVVVLIQQRDTGKSSLRSKGRGRIVLSLRSW